MVMLSVRRQQQLINASLITAGVLLVAKVIAAALTGSSGVYSDAAESVVHLLAVGFAAWAMRLSHKPADETHHFGHDKVAFLSAGFEGSMICVAAMLILYEAVRQWIYGVQINHIGLGITISAGAGVINLVLGLLLLRAARQSGSALLQANGEHVLTDVWTSAAVLVALLLIVFTGWVWWDPIAASLAALNILRVGIRLIRKSLGGLLDETDPVMEKVICETLDSEVVKYQASYHNFRHRHSGRTHWVEFHLVLPDAHSLIDAHEIATQIEAVVAELLFPDGRVISHLEPKSAEHAIERWESP